MRVWNNLIFKEEKKSFPLFSFMIFLSCHQESLVFTNILRGLGVVRQQLFQFMATTVRRLPTLCFPRKLSSYFIAKILTVRSRGASTMFENYSKMSHLNFLILAFLTNLCPFYNCLIWYHCLVANMGHFWHL